MENNVVAIRTGRSLSKNLRLYRIGLVRGYIIAERNTKTMERRYFITKWDQGFKMLEADRIDVIISNKYRGLKLLRELKIKDIKPGTSVSHNTDVSLSS